MVINPFQTTNFRLFQTERVADNNFEFHENSRKLSKLVESIVEKGEIAPFPTVFSKDLYYRHIKTRAYLRTEMCLVVTGIFSFLHNVLQNASFQWSFKTT